MNQAVLPNIPRLFTALAEWAACMIYVVTFRKRVHGFRLAALAAGALVVQCGVQWVAGKLPITFWIAGMMAAVCLMFLWIYSCANISALDAGFYCARAFVIAEFAASLEWQLYCYFFMNGTKGRLFEELLFLFVIYGLVFAIQYSIEARHMSKGWRFDVNSKEFFSASVMALSVFLFSNISFVYTNTPFSGQFTFEIFYIRTLVDFGGLMILYTQQEQHRESHLKYELDAVHNILHRQYEQYKQSKDNIEVINRTYHDLKHQINVIRAEENPQKKAAYLDEMERGIKMYEAQNKTGNSVLDTVLTSKSMYCVEHHINFTCVADGTLLDFMEVMDICTVFGNALDNAIESVKLLSDPEKRLIRLAVFAQNDLLMMRFENYFESELKYENGLLATTKKDRAFHGYGIKSIRYTAEKYSGSVTIHTENNWFTLCVLIPLPDKNK